MREFYELVPLFLPSWFIAALALLSALQGLAISVYLIRTNDHLVLHAADVGLLHLFPILVAIHYVMISTTNDTIRGVAVSRLSLALFFATDIVIMSRYLFAIRRSDNRASDTVDDVF